MRWEDNPYRPFCSERCRMIDLGHWLKGNYRLPEDPKKVSEDEQDVLDPDYEDRGDRDTKSTTLH